jgi:hypothetical protein
MEENIYLYHIYMLHTYCYMQLNVMCNLFYTIKQSLVTCVATPKNELQTSIAKTFFKTNVKQL